MTSVSMAMPLEASASASAAAAAQKRKRLSNPTSDAFFKPLHVKKPRPVFTHSKACKLRVEASVKEKAVAGVTAAAVAVSTVLPEAALAAESLTPSLKNFLLSIAAGGVVLGVIAGVVVGVANFDPVKRT